MTKSPKVSVIVPAYNVQNYIKETLGSIFNQTFNDYEVIVVNDGSTDKTKDKLLPYMNKIHYIEQENKGLAGARNTGIKAAKGEYLAFLDSDDLWLPQKLELQVEEMEKDPDVTVSYTDAFYLFDNKKSEKKWSESLPPHDGKVFPDLIKGNFIPVLSAMIRKKVLDKIGLFDENLRSVEDFDLWFRLAQENYEFKSIKKPLVYYRIRKGSLTQDPEFMEFSLMQVYKKLLNNPDNKYKKLIESQIKLHNGNHLYAKLIKELDTKSRWQILKSSSGLFVTQPSLKNFARIFAFTLFRKRYSQKNKKVNKRKIFIIRQAYALGGAEIYTLNLAKSLQENGFEVIIGTREAGLIENCQKEKIKTVKPIWIKRGALFAFLFIGPISLIQYFYYLYRYKIELVNIQNRNEQLIATMAAKILRIPIVWTDHGDLINTLKSKNGLFNFLFYRSMSYVSDIICVSKDEKDKILPKVKEKKLINKFKVIYNGVDKRIFDARNYQNQPSSKDKIIIGSTARIQWQKGMDYFFESMPQIIKKLGNNKAEFWLISACDDEKYKQIVSKYQLEKNVKFLGFQKSPKKIADLLSQIDIFVFPSLTEVFPLSMIEAMMMKRPIIATNVGGIPEQIENNFSGILIPAKNTKALVEKIVLLVNDPSLRSKLAKNAYDRAIYNFDINHIVKSQIIPMYNKLIEG